MAGQERRPIPENLAQYTNASQELLVGITFEEDGHLHKAGVAFKSCEEVLEYLDRLEAKGRTTVSLFATGQTSGTDKLFSLSELRALLG